MKCLRYNFSHPFKGNAILMQLFTKVPNNQKFKFDTKTSNVLEIPIKECQTGLWKLVLDWEHDNRIFCHQQEFEVK